MGSLQVEPARLMGDGSSGGTAPRVVVTGIGLVTPLGADRESSWQALCSGRSATRWLSAEELAHLAADGEVPLPLTTVCAAPAPVISSGGAWQDPVVSLALTAAAEAIHDARLLRPLLNPERAGCVIGTSKGGLHSVLALCRARNSKAVSGQNDPWRFVPPSAPAMAIAEAYDLQGAALAPVAACATGLVSIARGADLIREGRCDVVLAGSSDASLHPAVLGSFRRLGVLARPREAPDRACRPFDKRRSGFVVGEGGAVLVLESLEHALARGRMPYAEWLAGSLAADPAGLTGLDPEAASLTWLIKDVLHRAGVPSSRLDYVNLHGTATLQNDVSETRALKQALGRDAYSVATSSLKGALGHLLGGAGSVELAFTILALRDGRVPPTVNLSEPDPECDLDYTPKEARERQLETALKLSLGFGGHLAAGVLRRWPDSLIRGA